jgi:flagellar motor component MotA
LALATTLLTIVGVLVGVRFVLVGPISRPGDLLYHASLLIALLVTVPPLLRLRTRGGLTRRAG